MITIFGSSVVNTLIVSFIGIVSVAAVGLAIYMLIKTLKSDYSYKKFSLPMEEDFLIVNDYQKETSPLEESGFFIVEKTNDEFLEKTRKATENFHKEKEEELKQREKAEIKRMKKEIANKAKNKK